MKKKTLRKGTSTDKKTENNLLKKDDMPSARNGHQKTGSELSLINSQRQDGDRTL
jgi:hypothetical protein